MNVTGPAPAPTTIVFGTDGWRARIADEFTFENVRRCADGVARYVVERGETGQGRRRRLRPAVRLRALRRRPPPRSCSPTTSRSPSRSTPCPTQMSSYEVVERGAAAGHRHHRQPQPVGRQRLQGQGADRRRGRRATSSSVIEAQLARNGGDRPSSAGRSPTPRRPGWSSGSTRSTGYERFVRRTLDLDALRAADVVDPGRPDVGRRAAAGSRGCWPAAGSGSTEIHQERNPYFGGVNPEPIRPNVDEALAMLAGGGYDLGLLLDGDADRAGAADERGTFIHQLQVTGPADVLPGRAPRPARAGRRQRQQHLDGGAARRALRHRRPTRRRSGSSSSARR